MSGEKKVTAIGIIKSAAGKPSLKDVVIKHAETYGINEINELFPNHHNPNNKPVIIDNKVEWVAQVLNGVHRQPFARVKTMLADISGESARAKGYITTQRKEETFFELITRSTSPTTVYNKQKMDRDDIIDITDFDIVSFIKEEMKQKLNQELARAMILGDGRLSSDRFKINEESIRPIVNDDDLFTIKYPVDNNNPSPENAFVRACVKSRKLYKGSGKPVMFTTEDLVSDLLLLEDSTGNRIYKTEDDIKAILRVSDIITINELEGFLRPVNDNKNHQVLAVIVNLSDYSIGTDRGGEISLFDDFDIDYNQQKYLIETRCSGALTVPFSAIVIEKVTDKVATLEEPDKVYVDLEA